MNPDYLYLLAAVVLFGALAYSLEWVVVKVRGSDDV